MKVNALLGGLVAMVVQEAGSAPASRHGPQVAASEALSFVHQVLRSPGRPLDDRADRKFRLQDCRGGHGQPRSRRRRVGFQIRFRDDAEVITIRVEQPRDVFVDAITLPRGP